MTDERQLKETKKGCGICKKCLTNKIGYANIRRSPAGGGNESKNFEKTRKKFLTRRSFCDIIPKLSDEKRMLGGQQTAQKNLKKSVKSA